jgi:2-oxoglutarate ferredoxin oxidoreductase subunit beta
MAFIDVISPCVAFNNHSGSTKSYEFVRDHIHNVMDADLIMAHDEVTADYAEGSREDVAMPDGSTLQLYKVDADYDPHDRVGALNYVQRMQEKGEVVTGLLYVDPNAIECHDIMDTVSQPLNELAEADLCPGSDTLDALNQRYR